MYRNLTTLYNELVYYLHTHHGRLQDFETTWAKIKGWGLKGVLMGVVLIIIGCGHLLMDPGHA